MKFLKLNLIFTALTLFIISCSQNQTSNSNTAGSVPSAVNSNSEISAATPTDELAAARKIYSEQCINCHKEDGSGGITDFEGKKIKAPNFKSDRMKKDKDEHWIEAIENGEKEDGMPAFKGSISDEEIKNLVKLIRRDFQGK